MKPALVDTDTISYFLRSDPAVMGRTIGHNDVLIAATAMVHGLTLVTNNSDHFSRINGLDIDNWSSTGVASK